MPQHCFSLAVIKILLALCQRIALKDLLSWLVKFMFIIYLSVSVNRRLTDLENHNILVVSDLGCRQRL